MVARRERNSSQMAIREKLNGVDFPEAVATAVTILFRFSHRAKGAKALWSRNHAVWLGRSTFMHWSLNDEFDVPYCVSKAKNAPRNRAKLVEQVEQELTSQFADRLASLPKRNPGGWLPLP